MTGMISRVAGPAEQDSFLLHSGLSHLGQSFLNSFCFGQPIGVMHVQGDSTDPAAFTLVGCSFLRFQLFVLAATLRPTPIHVGLHVLDFASPAQSQPVQLLAGEIPGNCFSF